MNRLLKAISARVCPLALWLGVTAQAVPLAITNIAIMDGNPQLTIQSDVGITNQIQFNTNLNQTVGWR